VTADPEAELRHLRSRVATLEEDKRVLEERLAFAWQEVNRIRAKLLALGPSTLQTAPPGERRVEVEAVTPRQLAAVIEILRRVQPLSLAS
jgi:sigma54-dependent transcription regulator